MGLAGEEGVAEGALVDEAEDGGGAWEDAREFDAEVRVRVNPL